MFLVIHKAVNFVVLTKIVVFLTKKHLRIWKEINYSSSSFIFFKHKPIFLLDLSPLQRLLKHQEKDPKMEICKSNKDLTTDETLFQRIDSNSSKTLQEGKPFSSQTKASLFRTQFLRITITIKLIKRRMNKRNFGSSIPINLF